MASGGEPIPPIAGRCAVCASAKPVAKKLISAPKIAVRRANAPMPAAPVVKSCAGIFYPGAALGKQVVRFSTFNPPLRLHRDVVDQPGFSKLGRDQDSHRPILYR